MANLNMTVPHNLPEEEALRRIKNLFTELREEQKGTIENVEEEWNGNTGRFGFSAKGFDLSGTIMVNSTGVEIDAELPFAVSLFKGAIKQVIADKAGELLK